MAPGVEKGALGGTWRGSARDAEGQAVRERRGQCLDGEDLVAGGPDEACRDPTGRDLDGVQPAAAGRRVEPRRVAAEARQHARRAGDDMIADPAKAAILSRPLLLLLILLVHQP